MPCERKHIEAIERCFEHYAMGGSEHDYYEVGVAVRHALSACDESPWRSMESATRTEPVLAVVDGDVRVVRYGKTSHVPLYGWCIADMGPEEVDLCTPTHWMPLPAAPEVGNV